MLEEDVEVDVDEDYVLVDDVEVADVDVQDMLGDEVNRCEADVDVEDMIVDDGEESRCGRGRHAGRRCRGV